jgi:hypothetical protein
MMREWDEGRWCPICHQKHYQIHPPCFREEQRRKQTPATTDLAAAIRNLKPITPEARARFGFPFNAPTGADEEA